MISSRLSLRTLPLVALLVTTACTGPRGPLGSEKNPVKLYLIPSVDAKMITDKSKLIQAYLEKTTGYKFETAIPTSFIAVVEAFGTKRADVASLNTFGYLLAHDKYGAEARLINLRFGHDTYQAQIIARTDGPIKTFADINGKKFAFVDPASTSGYLMPSDMFAKQNVKPKETVFANRHDNVVTMVYQKQVDAGATFYSPPEDGKIQDARRLVKTQFPDVESQVKIIALTDPIPNDPIVFRKDLPEDMKEKITTAILDYIQTEEGKSVFYDLYGVTALKRGNDAAYDAVRSMLKGLGKSAEELAKSK